MAEHNLLYILELDGNASPDDLNAVSHCTNLCNFTIKHY